MLQPGRNVVLPRLALSAQHDHEDWLEQRHISSQLASSLPRRLHNQWVELRAARALSGPTKFKVHVIGQTVALRMRRTHNVLHGWLVSYMEHTNLL